MNLYLSLDFKTFDSFLILCTLQPKANLGQLIIKRPSLSVFWSYISTAANFSALTESRALTQHLPSGMIAMEILSSEVSRWQIPVTMMLKFSTIRNHPESSESQKCPKLLLCHRGVSPVEDVPSATQKFKSPPQANNDLPNNQSRGQHQNNQTRNLSLYPSLNNGQFPNSSPNLLLPKNPLLCVPSQTGLDYREYTLYHIPVSKQIQSILTIRCNNISLSEKQYQFLISCLNTFMCQFNSPM